MRLALISDIHANHVALEAVLRHVRMTGVDGIAFLGDYVTDFPGVRETMALLEECRREYPCWFIRGNREEYLLDYRKNPVPRWEKGTAKGNLLYAYERLTSDELDWFESLPISRVICPEGAKPFEICHATPLGSRKSAFYDRAFARRIMEGMPTDFMAVGHNHLTRCERLGKKQLWFVGSVGLPDSYAGYAQFAYLSDESGEWRAENQILPYDTRALLVQFDESGLSEYGRLWAKAVQAEIRTGSVYPLALATRGAELAEDRGVTGFIPEEIWEQAASELGLLP